MFGPQLGFMLKLMSDMMWMTRADMFKTFKDQKGNYKECISQDVKGMLSLYEATFLGYEGEDILEEARDFTCKHLKQIKQEISNSSLLSEQVNHALELPIHGISRHMGKRRTQTKCYSKRPNWILTWCSQYYKETSKKCQG